MQNLSISTILHRNYIPKYYLHLLFNPLYPNIWELHLLLFIQCNQWDFLISCTWWWLVKFHIEVWMHTIYTLLIPSWLVKRLSRTKISVGCFVVKYNKCYCYTKRIPNYLIGYPFFFFKKIIRTVWNKVTSNTRPLGAFTILFSTVASPRP